MNEFEKLKCKAESHKLKVKFVTRKTLADYDGMNDLAAKQMGNKRYPKRTIQLLKNDSQLRKLHTLRHELVERSLIKNKGMHYNDAHKIALKREHKKVRIKW